MKITKRQLKQIIQEELTAVIKEGYAEDFGKGVGYVTDKVVSAPAKIGRAVKKVGSDILSGFDSQTDVRVPASDRKKPITPEEWAKTANPNDGSPRWADSDYTDAYDARNATGGAPAQALKTDASDDLFKGSYKSTGALLAKDGSVIVDR